MQLVAVQNIASLETVEDRVAKQKEDSISPFYVQPNSDADLEKFMATYGVDLIPSMMTSITQSISTPLKKRPEVTTGERDKLKYLTHEGFRNVWVNRLMSLASVTVLMACLIIMGAGIMIYFNINNVVDKVQSQNSNGLCC